MHIKGQLVLQNQLEAWLLTRLYLVEGYLSAEFMLYQHKITNFQQLNDSLFVHL